MPAITFLQEDEDLDWMFDKLHLNIHQLAVLQPLTVCACLYGNEDAPERIDLFNKNDYRALPIATFRQNAEGDLVRS